MNTINTKQKTVSIKNGQISIEYKENKPYSDSFNNENIDNTHKLFSNNKIIDRCLFQPIRTGIKNPLLNIDMSERVKDNSRPLTITEFTLKGFNLPLNLITVDDINLIKSNAIEQIQIRNCIIPIHKGTLDLRVWISKKEITNSNIDDKQTTVSKLYNEQQKLLHQKELRSERNKRYIEKKKAGYVKSIKSSNDILSLNACNHIGTQTPLKTIDLWENKTVSINDDTQKQACAYLTLNNHRMNYEKLMNDEIVSYGIEHNHRLITAIDNKKLALINIRKIEDIKAKKLDMELNTYANTQKSNYELKIHVCTDMELIQISYTKYLSMEKHLSSMGKTHTQKAKHNMHN